VVRVEKPRVFLLKSSWTSSTAAELSSWTWLQLSWASSAAAELFSWAELQLSWAFSTSAELNFSCEPLWPYTSWTCLRAVELGFSLLNSLVKTSWTGPEGQFSWSLTPLTSVLQSASQTGKQVARAVRGGSTAPPGRFNRSWSTWPVCRSVWQSDWQTVCLTCQGRLNRPRGRLNRPQAENSAQRLVLSSHYIYYLLPLSPK